MWQDALSQSVSQGEIEAFGREDILAKALKVLEHPGRVRGVGFGVSQKEYFHGPKRSKFQNQYEIQRLKGLVESLQQQMLQMAHKMDSMQMQPGGERQQDDIPGPSAKDSCGFVGSVNLPEVIDILTN